MISPIRKRRNLARHRGQLAFKKITEGLAERIDIFAVAIDKIHRHIERVIHIALKPHTVLKDERQHTGARIVQVAPDIAAPGFMTVKLALKERRIGKQRDRNGLQCKRDAEFLDHVGLRAKVEIDLHGASAAHHGAAHGPDFLHIVVHQPITPFGHQRHVLMRPNRSRPKTNKFRTNLIRDILHFA